VEILIAGLIGGVALGLGLFWVVNRAVGAAFENLTSWLIPAFGSDDAVAQLERDRQSRVRQDT
jgi:hypothetical protein